MVSTDEQTTVEQAATELLKAQVFAAYQSRKFTAIWELFEMQIALNTQCEIDNAALRSTNYFECISKDEGFAAQQALVYCNGEMETCLEQVHKREATNAALVEFVAVSRELFRQLDADFGFMLDAAASHDNALCPVFFTADEDGGDR